MRHARGLGEGRKLVQEKGAKSESGTTAKF